MVYCYAYVSAPAFSHCRVRNYDLITAVEVLTTGTYSQLPSLFKVCRTWSLLQCGLLTIQVVQDSFIPPPKLTNDAVVALLQDLESVIRLRLQLHEHIPVQLLRRPYRIRKLLFLFASFMHPTSAEQSGAQMMVE